MPWFRMYAEFANDPKVQMMDESLQRRFVMLLCMRCSNVSGTFHGTFEDAEIGFQMRISDDEVKRTKDAFLKRGLINGNWKLLHWDARQFVADSSTERVRKHRQKMKRSNTVTLERDETVSVTPPDTDTEEARARTKAESKAESRSKAEKKERERTNPDVGGPLAEKPRSTAPAIASQSPPPEPGASQPTADPGTLAPAAAADRTTKQPRRSAARRIELGTWLDSLPADEPAIHPDDPVFRYAKDVGIPPSFVALAWDWFCEEMTIRKIRKTDWRRHFRNAVRGRWGQLWWFDPKENGAAVLTTQGEQARRSFAAPAVEPHPSRPQPEVRSVVQ